MQPLGSQNIAMGRCPCDKNILGGESEDLGFTPEAYTDQTETNAHHAQPKLLITIRSELQCRK